MFGHGHFRGHRGHHFGRHGHGHGPGGWGRGGPFGGGGWDFDEGDGGRGRGRHRQRLFDGGELRLMLLKLIDEQPRHGYDLIREIEERTGGGYAPSPGVVYPTLSLLDEMGLIAEAQSDGAKKQFAITEAGRAHLAEREGEVAALFERLGTLNDLRSRMRAGPIKRAMTNLRIALAQRMSAEEADAETQHAIAQILDEAAQKIERL